MLMADRINQGDMFEVFLHSQQLFNNGQDELSDTINRLYDFYLENAYTEHQRDVQCGARERFWDGKETDAWQYLENDEEYKP